MKVYCRMKRKTFALISFFSTYLFLNNAHGNHDAEIPSTILRYSTPNRETINFGRQVGKIQSLHVKGANAVKIVRLGSQSYYMKDKSKDKPKDKTKESLETLRQLALREALDSIIATRLLNRINGDFHRFPNLTLGYDDRNRDNNIIFFKVFSEGLSDFKSINEMSLDEIQNLNLSDLENLYISLILVGGGDPHGDNIFYSSKNSLLSNVDFDVSFKTHISRNAQEKKERVPNNNFRPIQSDLAIRDFDCSFPYSNFLTTTDTLFSHPHKQGHYQRYLEDKINKREISSVAILNAIRRVLDVPLRDLIDIIERVVDDIRVELNHLNNGRVGKIMSFLYNDNYKDYISDFVARRYHFFQCLNDTAFIEESMDNIKCARCLEDSCHYAIFDNDLGVCDSNAMCWIKPFF